MTIALPRTPLAELVHAAEIVPAIFKPSQLWWGLQAAAVRKYRRGRCGTVLGTFRLTAEETRQLAGLTDAQISLALERALMHISALETSIFRLVQVQAMNASLLRRNRWRQYALKITIAPR